MTEAQLILACIASIALGGGCMKVAADSILNGRDTITSAVLLPTFGCVLVGAGVSGMLLAVAMALWA